ncbi:MAG: sugar phosphate isomerase/epimerase family protein [Victivallaceae bacterium]|nr:sugar phosphate isomerase/epimerase family protein [Victivallaceae bacterium]
MKIGVIAELLRKPLEDDIAFAAEIGVAGVQLCVKHGDDGLDLAKCPDSELEALDRLVKSHGLVITAICGDLGGSFQLEHECWQRVELMKKIFDAAAKLGVKVVTTHIGHIPECPGDPVYATMLSSVRAAADYACSRGCVLAIETGPELADVLKAFIEGVGSKGLGVNLDPANLRGVACEDPVYAVKTLAPYIVHTHAKDAVNLHVGSAARFYGLRNPDGSLRNITARAAGFKEVPLGTGMVPWNEYLAALKEIGFDGFLTIERECGEDPVGDIKMAVGFLKEKLAAL